MQTSQFTNPIYCLTEVLTSVNNRVAEVEARLAALKLAAKDLTFGSHEEQYNYAEQRAAWGELLGLAHCQGALEGRINVTEIWMS